MRLDSYWDKVFKAVDEMDKERKFEIEEPTIKKYCENFIAGDDGFCKYYTGSKVYKSSCSSLCNKK